MSTLTKYLLNSLARPFLISVGLVLLFMMSRRLVRLYTTVQDHPDAWSLSFDLMYYLIPHYLGLAIPLGFFIALLLGMRRMSEDVEVDAMFASGMSMFQMLRPVILLSLVFMVLTFAIFAWAKPYARYEYRTLLHSPQLSSGYFLAAEDTFLKAGPYTFIVNDLSRGQQKFGRFFAYKEKPDGARLVVTSRSGSMVYHEKQDKSVLVLEKGIQFTFKPDAKKEPAGQTNTMEMEQVAKPLLSGSRKASRLRGEDERELTAGELYSLLQHPRVDGKISSKAAVAELSDRIIRSLLVLLSPLLAVPFAFADRRRKSSMPVGGALSIMFAYYGILFAGRWGVAFGNVSPLVGQWLPFVGFTLLTLFLFRRMGFVHHRKIASDNPSLHRHQQGEAG